MAGREGRGDGWNLAQGWFKDDWWPAAAADDEDSTGSRCVNGRGDDPGYGMRSCTARLDKLWICSICCGRLRSLVGMIPIYILLMGGWKDVMRC